jgi:hypothetical protein
MKRIKSRTTLVACAIFLIVIIGIASAFSFSMRNKKPVTDWTNYYWFDAAGYYLGRQNTIDDEIDLTGYDEFSYAPYTLREKGYAPANDQGDPPIPNEPYNPSKRLYTHP